MKKFENREAAFASQNYDPNAVEITGIPAHHVDAVKAFANLCVAHDAVNPKFNPDFTNSDWKYSPYFVMGDPSGAGFAFYGYDFRGSYSLVGARLSSESSDATKHIAEICEPDYRAMMVYDRKTE